MSRIGNERQGGTVAKMAIESPTVQRHSLTADSLLTVAVAAKLLHLSRATIYNEINAGRLPAILGGGARTLLWRSDIEDWLHNRYTG